MGDNSPQCPRLFGFCSQQLYYFMLTHEVSGSETHAKVALLIYRQGWLLFTCVRTFSICPTVRPGARAPGAYDEYVIPVLSTELNFDLLTAK